MAPRTRPFSSETGEARAARALEIADRLDERHPDAGVALESRDPLQLLVATILSAQCTDERVNQVTPILFDRFPDAGSLAAADLEEIEEIIHSTGFFRQKAKSIKGSSLMIMEQFEGEVPREMDDLTSLPGIGAPERPPGPHPTQRAPRCLGPTSERPRVPWIGLPRSSPPSRRENPSFPWPFPIPV